MKCTRGKEDEGVENIRRKCSRCSFFGSPIDEIDQGINYTQHTQFTDEGKSLLILNS